MLMPDGTIVTVSVTDEGADRYSELLLGVVREVWSPNGSTTGFDDLLTAIDEADQFAVNVFGITEDVAEFLASEWKKSFEAELGRRYQAGELKDEEASRYIMRAVLS